MDLLVRGLQSVNREFCGNCHSWYIVCTNKSDEGETKLRDPVCRKMTSPQERAYGCCASECFAFGENRIGGVSIRLVAAPMGVSLLAKNRIGCVSVPMVHCSGKSSDLAIKTQKKRASFA